MIFHNKIHHSEGARVVNQEDEGQLS